MGTKKKSKKKVGKLKALKKPSGPPLPPVHELWSLEVLHSQYEETLRELHKTKQQKFALEDKMKEQASDFTVQREKHEEQFEKHKKYVETLVERTREAEEKRLESEKEAKEKIEKMSNFTVTAQKTVAKISKEWQDKQKLIREAEGTVVRNAKLEIDNTQLSRTNDTLRHDLGVKQKQLYVVNSAEKAAEYIKKRKKDKPGEDAEDGDGDEEDQEEGEERCAGLSPLIFEAMKQFPDINILQRESMTVLSHLIKDLSDVEYITSASFPSVDLILRGMRKHRSDGPLQTSGARLLWKIASLKQACRARIKEAGGVAMLIDTLANFKHENSRRMVSNIIRLLKTLIDHSVRLEPEDVVNVEKKKSEGSLGYFPRVEKKRNRALAAMNKRGNGPKDIATMLKLRSDVGEDGAAPEADGGDEDEKKTQKLQGEQGKEETLQPNTTGTDDATEFFDNNSEGSSIMKALMITLHYQIGVIKVKQSRQQESNANFKISTSLSIDSPVALDAANSISPTSVAATHNSSVLFPTPGKEERPSLLQKQATMNSGGKGLSRHSSLPNMSSKTGPGGNLKSKKEKPKRKSVHDDTTSDEEEEEERGGIGNGENGGSMANGVGDGGVIDEINAENEWMYETDGEIAKNLLVGIVLATDGDEDSGGKRVLSWPNCQMILCEALDLLKSDKDIVTAVCMLIRSTLHDDAKRRLVQVGRLIDFQLGRTFSELLVIWDNENEVSSVTKEINALLGELGTQFAKHVNAKPTSA